MEHLGIEAQLVAAKSRLNTKTQLEEKLHELRAAIRVEEQKIAALLQTLKKEQSEYEKLEGLSLEGLFYSILGNKEQQIEKERQEYLVAKLNYDQALGLLNMQKEEKVRLMNALKSVKNADKEYAEVLALKEQYLISEGKPESHRLLNLAEEMADASSQIKELKEAHEVAQKLIAVLKEVLSSLNSASNWGTWDLLGGGMISTYVKHSRINDAKEMIARSQFLIAKLVKEMKDVNDVGLHVERIEIDSLLTFADYFFDGLIADFMVQNKISNAKNSVERTHHQIVILEGKLSNQIKENLRLLDQLKDKQQKILEGV